MTYTSLYNANREDKDDGGNNVPNEVWNIEPSEENIALHNHVAY